jgi:dGTPase
VARPQPPLEALRFPVEASRGRRYPEASHSFRNDFQRDRDRIIHSRAFRRLENKTQVFPAGLSDHFRNRLTHTMEVAQLARTAARVLGLDEDFVEALALAHDIGHPPFGHSGEEELNQLLAVYGARFDHNLHALRIVEQFEQRFAFFSGLNLTFEVREGILKHSRDAGPEHAEYLPELHPPLEAQLIDLVDEIAYNAADLDDAFAAGFFTLDGLAAESPACAAILETLDTMMPAAAERIRMQELLRRLIDEQMRGLMDGIVAACKAAQVQNVEDVRRFPHRLVRHLPASEDTTRRLKQFLQHTVYNSAALRRERERSSAAVRHLFTALMEDPSRLPEAYREAAENEPLWRIVCDYIAGMTDGYLMRHAEEL